MAGDAKPSSTTEFADAIISNLGQDSRTGSAGDFLAVRIPEPITEVATVDVSRRIVTGVDVFLESTLQPAELGAALQTICEDTTLTLHLISNRGSTVFPSEDRTLTLVDHYRCRFMKKTRSDTLSNAEILALLTRIGEEHTWMHVEKLQQFDGDDAFSRTQK
jgi:isocitrate dehydrogenase